MKNNLVDAENLIDGKFQLMRFIWGRVVLVKSQDVRVLALVPLYVTEYLAALIVAKNLHNYVIAFAVTGVGINPRRFAMKESWLAGRALHLNCISSLDAFEAGWAENTRNVLAIHYEPAICSR